MNHLSFLVLLALPGLAGAQSFVRDLSSGPERAPILPPSQGRIGDAFTLTQTTNVRDFTIYATSNPNLQTFTLYLDNGGSVGARVSGGSFLAFEDLGPMIGSAYGLRRWSTTSTNSFTLQPGNYFFTAFCPSSGGSLGRVSAVDDALVTAPGTFGAYSSISGGDLMFAFTGNPVPEPASLLVLSLGVAFRKGRRRG